jgi:hypothetical protein
VARAGAASVIPSALAVAAALLFALPVVAEAQAKPVRIGVLWPGHRPPAPGPYFDSFRHALRELGHREEQHVTFEHRLDGRGEDRDEDRAA